MNAPPDPGRAGTLDELTQVLRLLKVWAGDPSYEMIKNRINAAWSAAGRPAGELARKNTVADCFKRGRRRINADLVIAVVRALHPDAAYAAQWAQALRFVGGEITAAAQVRVQDRLPEDPAGFAGRAAELSGLPRAGTVVITGMAGVGKTEFAVRAGHRLGFARVLFVNLRGFDPSRPPAEPGAVLDGFLRGLGMPGGEIPHDLPGRKAAYRARLAGTPTLVVLDDAADEAQIRPLLAERPDCLTLVTSRRRLAGLPLAARVVLDVFTADEATAYLIDAAPEVPIGPDPEAPARIARRCGYLPLAVGLVAGRLRGRPGWTFTDHADRLDACRLEAGVELALDVSYRHLPTERRWVLRSLSLHPAQDFDAYAVTALAGIDLVAATGHLDLLHRDHLLRRGPAGRFTCHDLVRAYAAERAADEDRRTDREAARTRLLDYYVGTAAAAMDALHPAETASRPRVPRPATPTPNLSRLDVARDWLDTERPTLVMVGAHGDPAHAVRLSAILYRYLDSGYLAEAITLHRYALRAAEDLGDDTAQARALAYLASVDLRLGRYGPAVERFERALALSRRDGDLAGQARSLSGLGFTLERLGRYSSAVDHLERALPLFRRVDDLTGEARALDNLGIVEARLGRRYGAIEHYRRALVMFRQAGDRGGEARTLNNLGYEEARLGRHSAADHLHQALAMHHLLGNRVQEAWTLDSLGTMYQVAGQPTAAAEQYRQAEAIFHEIGARDGQATVLNGLGEVAAALGDPARALTLHTEAAALALDCADREQQARAHTGLARAHDALNQAALSARHRRRAGALYRALGQTGEGPPRVRGEGPSKLPASTS
ncbi:tetratricopeptide repeat protein [Paractinoplanes globisporus]|uniref:Tetratricopeptide repeat protein n=1 Tax=Paractinoplanes globisporus TaxID=113565 RepID=A0ABW6W721_9ACTN|nr:tetratricopeptide repeat protein [Actinoplanes globisporus]